MAESTSHSSSDPMVGRVVLGRYRLEKVIGSGGMGSVWVANQTAVDRPVAVKLLRPELLSSPQIRARFKREAEVIAKLRHPHSIQLFDYGDTEDGMAVMVTELLLGTSLQDLLAERGRLSEADTVRIGEQVAGALAEAHDLGLVHRDLKPANLFVSTLDGQPHAKVLDFGIARLVDEEQARITQTGQVFGTPRYMSPEQTMGAGGVDRRSDIYSLGLVLYECLTGDSPFRAETSVQYLAAHHSQEPPALREQVPDVSPRLEGLVRAMLAKDPADRPADARVVRNELQAVLAGEATRMEGANLGVSAPLDGPARHALTQRSFVVGPAAGAGTLSETFVRQTAEEAPPTPRARAPRTRLWMGALAAVGVGFGAAAAAWWSANTVPSVESVVLREPETTDPPSTESDPALDVRSGPGEGKPAAPVEPPARDGAGTPPKASGEGPGPDSERAETDRSPSDRPRRDDRSAPRRRSRPDPSPPAGLVVTGPRGMVVPDAKPEGDGSARAAACQTSEWKGLGAVTTRGCPDGCAILVDAVCAGRTPAEARQIAPGRRTVQVFCGGRLRHEARVRFRAAKDTVVSCR
jgi:eukaryotic-like serine/threonine-protein kinase